MRQNTWVTKSWGGLSDLQVKIKYLKMKQCDSIHLCNHKALVPAFVSGHVIAGHCGVICLYGEKFHSRCCGGTPAVCCYGSPKEHASLSIGNLSVIPTAGRGGRWSPIPHLALLPHAQPADCQLPTIVYCNWWTRMNTWSSHVCSSHKHSLLGGASYFRQIFVDP